MTRISGLGAVFASFALASFGGAVPGLAATTTTTVTGALGPTAQGCLQELTQQVGNGENCMYDGGPASGTSNPGGEITGPFAQVHYYDSVATPQAFSVTYVPTHASGQISQRITGTVTVDDNGTASGTDDLISFSLTQRSPGSGDVIRHLGATVVDRYTSMTQVLAPTLASSATVNGSGGFDYVIGSEGFPALLTFSAPAEPANANPPRPSTQPCLGQPFGTFDCAATFEGASVVDPDRWSGTAGAGLGSLEGNLGARTVGSLVNADCVGTNGTNTVNDCLDSKVSFAPLARGPNQVVPPAAAEDVGWDQLLLKVSTNASGQVMSIAGFDVQEYQVFGGPVVRCGSDPNSQGPCNSWLSGYFTGSGIAANDDGPVLAPESVEVEIDVLANDTGFNDPVTVTIITPPVQGVAEVRVNGSPGSQGDQANIRIAYTANVGTSGTDSLVYMISDGTSSDTATLSLTDTVGPLTPDARGGSITINTAGAGGAPGSAPLNLTGTFAAPGPGGSLGNPPFVVSITAQGARGTASVAGATITYTITDAAFFAGSDSFTYLITDDDGETSSATVTVSIPNATPTIDIWDISADQDHASPNFAIGQFVRYGNGSQAQHSVTVTTQAANGACTVSPADGTGQLTYVPNAGYSGSDSCQVTVADGDGESAADTVVITVNRRNGVEPDIGGASSLGPWHLLLLLVAAFARPLRRPHRPHANRASAGYRRASGVVVLAMALGWSSAHSQDGDEDEGFAGDSLAIQEIVVTARKVEEKLKEVPVAVTAFDSAAIESAGITNLSDVAALTPGLSFFNAIGEVLPVPVIRGVVPTDIFGENNAAIFVDGVYIAGREGLNFSQLDVERIEVVKGPQSALYGRNAFSGAINYITKRPSEEFEAKTTGELGNRDRRKGTVSLSGPVFGESLRGRASLLYDEWDGSYTNSIPGGPDIGGYRFRSYQGSLLWLPADAWEVGISYYKSNDDLDEPAIIGLPSNCEDKVEAPPNTAGYPVQPGVRFLNFCGKIPDLDYIPGVSGNNTMPKILEATGENRELDRANLKIDWDLYERGRVSALTGYSKTRQDARFDFGRGTGYNQPFRYCSPATLGDPGVPNACRDESGTATPANQIFFTGLLDEEPGDETEEYSQELRWTSPQDQRLRITSGAYWYTVNLKHIEGNPIATHPLPAAPSATTAIGLAPFDPTAPDFAIGTAIFYGTFADNPFTAAFDPDGGVFPDPLRRLTNETDTEAWALFTGMDFDLTERLTARGELRVSHESKETQVNEYTECSQRGYAVPDPDDATQLIPNPCGDDLLDLRVTAPANTYWGNTRFTQWTGRGGLKFQVNDDWMTYGSIAYGEKPGGISLLIEPLAPDPVTGQVVNAVIADDFEPEKITAYEIGAKGYLFDRRLSLDVAVFWNDWRDIVLRQLLENDPTTGQPLEQPAGVNVNAGDATVLGAEASAQVRITENLTGDLTLGWVDAELDNARMDTYARFPSFRAEGCFPEQAPPGTPDQNREWFENCNSISGDVSGNTLLRQPEWKSSLSLNYRRQLVGDWEWYTRGDVSYQSELYIGNDNENWIPSRTVVNTKFGVSSGRYRVEMWVRNLFDDRSAVASFRDIWFANSDNLYAPYVDQGPRPSFDDFVPFRNSVSYPSGRTFGITGEMRFGAAAQ